MPASSLHLDMLPFRHLPVKKEAFSNLQPVFGYKKRPCPSGHSLTPYNLRKEKPPQTLRLRRSISLSISILTCTYFHCNTIHMPVYCQFTATLLPLFFQFISSILFCIFSGRVNAQSIVAYNRIAFLRFR